ncbi:class I SAM-dependent methyltransferase [Dokdonella immobilis]|uniref:Methyltransferase domain-containing protein n=1 Tax=Dokdonella immobilis TaxID=578942 RepID=A0A1I4WWY6_9GAMM|nr:class I SAM-dependent methyltransferase [Dokdonella immobilis]SFN17985.1 Methyltransferase domain-containing protein [Dokdonella immobilis]
MSGETEHAQLERLRRVWAVLGQDDPLWAVLSRADKRGGRWDVEEFLVTGRTEIDGQLALLAGWNLPQQRRSALDFGCGAGRLTRALAAHFGEAIGIDVSPSMIAKARSLNADLGNLRFIENRSARLDAVADASIDLVYSCITLQHIPADLAFGYVAEFLRVLTPGGVAAFQFVAGTDRSWRGRLFALMPNRWLNPLRRLAWRRQAVFEMHVLEESRLRDLLARDPGVRLLAAIDDGAAGAGWSSRRWYLTREDAANIRAD